jgi:hypothetical protein
VIRACKGRPWNALWGPLGRRRLWTLTRETGWMGHRAEDSPVGNHGAARVALAGRRGACAFPD